MYSLLLTIHSWFRWLVLISLIYTTIKAYVGWKSECRFSSRYDKIRHWTATITHVQLLLGLSLYCISPLVTAFWSDFSETVHNKELRLFGMEHIISMLIAVLLITIGSMKAKRESSDKKKFKIIAIYFTIGLIIILSSIPWGFGPLVTRPLFRL